MPIAAFLKNATLRMPTVNATTVTFAETSEDTGKDKKSSRIGLWDHFCLISN